MTRTTDPDDHEHFQPLGHPIPKPTPKPPADKRVAPGVLQRPDGRLHTDIPLPKETP